MVSSLIGSNNSLAKICIKVGIVSFGPSPCDATYPAVYTRVAGYSNWVMETIAANGGL